MRQCEEEQLAQKRHIVIFDRLGGVPLVLPLHRPSSTHVAAFVGLSGGRGRPHSCQSPYWYLCSSTALLI